MSLRVPEVEPLYLPCRSRQKYAIKIWSTRGSPPPYLAEFASKVLTVPSRVATVELSHAYTAPATKRKEKKKQKKKKEHYSYARAIQQEVQQNIQTKGGVVSNTARGAISSRSAS